MDAAALDRQAQTLSGCIPPLLVSRLLELGHGEEVEVQAEQHAPANSDDLVSHLIGLGRVNDAVALLQQRDSEPDSPVWTGSLFNDPPF